MARQCDGVDDVLVSASAIDLSGVSEITLSFWLYWNAYANDDDIAVEFGNPNYLSNGFQVDPNFFNGTFAVGFAKSPSSEWFDTFARPSAATWHQYLVGLDRPTPSLAVWVDNSFQSLTAFSHAATTYGNFGNTDLSLMSRMGTSLFAGGRIAEFAIYSGSLSSGQRASLQTDSPSIVGSPLFYWPLCGTASPEPDGAGGVDLTVSGAVFVASPVLSGSPCGAAEEGQPIRKRFGGIPFAGARLSPGHQGGVW